MGRFAAAIVRHRRAVLAGSMLMLLASFAYGGKVVDKLSNGGFADPSSPSSKATNLLDHQFHTGSPNLVLVVTARSGSVNTPAVAAAGLELTDQLNHTAGVDDATSYWSLGDVAPMRSTNGREASPSRSRWCCSSSCSVALVAAWLPLAVAALAVGGTFAALTALTHVLTGSRARARHTPRGVPRPV